MNSCDHVVPVCSTQFNYVKLQIEFLLATKLLEFIHYISYMGLLR